MKNLEYPNGRWNTTEFFEHLTATNRLAKSEHFTFCRVSGLDGFEEALDNMQQSLAFVCVSDIANGFTELNNTPRTRRVKTVFMAMRHKIDSDTKEGGDWSTNIQEAVNMVCFTMRVHSNLVGSVPGKTQTNNSGSDKRELYTIAQALQKPYHDLLFTVHQMIVRFNDWQGCKVDVPFIQLTTLNKHCDAQEVTIGRCDAANIRMQTHEVARASSQQESPQ